MLQCQHVSTVCFDRRTLRSWLVSTMFCQTRKMVSKLVKKLRRCLQLYLDLFICKKEAKTSLLCARKMLQSLWKMRLRRQGFFLSIWQNAFFWPLRPEFLFGSICVNRAYEMTHDYDIIIVASNTVMKHNRQPTTQLPCGHCFFGGEGGSWGMLTHTCDISVRCTVHIMQIHKARESQSL